MIVDTSVLVAILGNEDSAAELLTLVSSETTVLLSAAGYLETSIVVDKRRSQLVSMSLDELIESMDIHIEPFTADQARIARVAYREFGKGSGHPAQLNFGDCFSYALARSRGEPILFTGHDFHHTDLTAALPS